jgi:hypothetical protein
MRVALFIALLSSNTYPDMSIPHRGLPAFAFRETLSPNMGYGLCGGWEFSINFVS